MHFFSWGSIPKRLQLGFHGRDSAARELLAYKVSKSLNHCIALSYIIPSLVQVRIKQTLFGGLNIGFVSNGGNMEDTIGFVPGDCKETGT